jgi:hypothetical protein
MEDFIMKNNSYNAGNLAVIILSSVSFVYLLYAANFPTTAIADLSSTFIKKWECSKDQPCKAAFKIEIPSRLTEAGTSFSEEFIIENKGSEVNIKGIGITLAKKIEKRGLKDLLVKTYIEENNDKRTDLIAVSNQKGGYLTLSLKPLTSNGSLQDWKVISSEKLNGDPIAFFQNYFSILIMPFVLFGMIFFLVRSSMPYFNSATILANRTEKIKRDIGLRLENFQDMDKFIYIEALSRIFKDDKALLKEFEGNDLVNKITIISKDLKSDLLDEELQKQIVKNLLRKIKYRWVISNESGREPLDQLIFALKKVVYSQFDNKKQKEEKLNECLKCMNFYSVNRERFYSLPYELNFYSMEGETHLVVFEGENKIDLTNCSEVRPIKKMISNWMREARDCNQETLYFDSCKGVTSHITQKNGKKKPIDKGHSFYKENKIGVNYYSTNHKIINTD